MVPQVGFGLAVLFRLYQEVWSNALVVGGFYGAPRHRILLATTTRDGLAAATLRSALNGAHAGVVCRTAVEPWACLSRAGPTHSTSWWLGACLSTLIPVIYSFTGGMRASVMTDMSQVRLQCLEGFSWLLVWHSSVWHSSVMQQNATAVVELASYVAGGRCLSGERQRAHVICV